MNVASGAYDIAIVGGGINGAGIAADAAGRGLRVLLIEKGDLASGTSSASSKLIHGGLRYLEHYEFRLVAEALSEREILLRKAPHIVWPMRFILPHARGQRPRWMIRAGLAMYDRLGQRERIPSSAAIDLARSPPGVPLRTEITQGFAYWDCWVDDARLVVLNARAAADRGADIRPQTELEAARVEGHYWDLQLKTPAGRLQARAGALVNAAGPWVSTVARRIALDAARNNRSAVRLVKGSHIIVPRLEGASDAYLLQSADGRVVFVLPFEDRFSLIGTTDVAFDGDPGAVAISKEEQDYLIDVVAHFFRQRIFPDKIVWSYSGIRPLYDDNSANLSAVSRDYHLTLDALRGKPPLLTIYGGKVTTYRRLAEEALTRLAPHMRSAGDAWTATAPLPGGDLPDGDFDSFLARLHGRRPGFTHDFLRRLARRHGTVANEILGDAKRPADLGRPFGGELTEREVLHFKDREWARTAEDILWRRTKVGLHLEPEARRKTALALSEYLA